jgi:hypothetical protein
MEKLLGVIIVVSFLLYCSFFDPSPPSGPDVIAYPLPQGCFIYTASYQGALNARGVLNDRYYWSCVYAVKFKDMDMYHAGLIFYYFNDTWVYDCNLGSYKISNDTDIRELKQLLALAYPDADIEDCFWVESQVVNKEKVESIIE